ncbi:hypothetical protein E2562_006294 [Oryza meyeriana var. granulata]|uniref:Uncharacterized protein n=1 Tax=Oryza meyeriana var. granulata TaxID=110450 RepID=A0A6G1EF02_9ORYZ|nr:hypothetical protein E2562_006294 [Oryza meyeriana var. granulata]
MSEVARGMRRLSGSSGGGNAAVAGEWDGGGGGGGNAGRIRGVNAGIMDEKVLELVFRALNWDPRALCVVAREPAAVAAAAGRIGGGWPALAKLLFFCCGAAGAGVPGHFAPVSRFSKTSGRSFLSRRCAGDLLYVSDPCEHAVAGAADDVGAYRGVFRGFMRSRTRAFLVGHRAPLEPRVRCPYCGARVWSMTAAGLAPRSACRRLGANAGRLEYFVCVSGHLHGSCWLARLSSSSEDERGADSDSDSNHSDEETFAAADDVSLSLPTAGHVSARRLRGRPAM